MSFSQVKRFFALLNMPQPMNEKTGYQLKKKACVRWCQTCCWETSSSSCRAGAGHLRWHEPWVSWWWWHFEHLHLHWWQLAKEGENIAQWHCHGDWHHDWACYWLCRLMMMATMIGWTIIKLNAKRTSHVGQQPRRWRGSDHVQKIYRASWFSLYRDAWWWGCEDPQQTSARPMRWPPHREAGVRQPRHHADGDGTAEPGRKRKSPGPTDWWTWKLQYWLTALDTEQLVLGV